jgi:hypothetical protein
MNFNGCPGYIIDHGILQSIINEKKSSSSEEHLNFGLLKTYLGHQNIQSYWPEVRAFTPQVGPRDNAKSTLVRFEVDAIRDEIYTIQKFQTRVTCFFKSERGFE